MNKEATPAGTKPLISMNSINKIVHYKRYIDHAINLLMAICFAILFCYFCYFWHKFGYFKLVNLADKPLVNSWLNKLNIHYILLSLCILKLISFEIGFRLIVKTKNHDREQASDILMMNYTFLFAFIAVSGSLTNSLLNNKSLIGLGIFIVFLIFFHAARFSREFSN